jgi:two-component system response regulator YesN
MFYRVMLVDDEQYDLEWLKRAVPWRTLGLELAGTEHSGFAALKRLENEEIHILVTDIRMPIMSGLELAKRARESHPGLRILFISGYEDFQYAKQALSLSAIGYILKPVKLQELEQMLKETANALDNERQQLIQKHQMERTLPMLKDAFVQEWLEGNIDGEEGGRLAESYEIVSPTNRYMAVRIELDDLDWKLNRYPKSDQERIRREVLERLVAYVDTHQLGAAFSYKSYVIVIVSEVPNSVLRSSLGALIEQVKSSSELTITAGLGTWVERIYDLPQSYEESKSALSYKMFLGKSRVIGPDDLQGKVLQGAFDLDVKTAALLHSMLHYDLVGIDDQVVEIFDYVAASDTSLNVYNFTLHLIATLDKQFERLGERLFDLLSWDYRNLDILFQFETVEDIKSWLRRRLFEISELFMLKMKKKGSHTLIQDILDYTQQHLGEKLTLRSLSVVFGFTPNYLGQLFKENTGDLFTDYLMKKRMEKAAELLSDPVMKIYEIADATGYKNLIYFNRHFKEFFGVTPSEYRRK